MKILAIRLKNLASLAGPFELDFTAEPLASAGLFAITGPTGAGKSTLLDALCLGLFGAVPRLNKASQGTKVPDAEGEIGSNDPRSLLRRGTGSGFAEVDFVGNDGRRYRARWEANRARDKAAGKLQSSRQSLRDLDSDQLLASQKGDYKTQLEARLGLNFEQFTRAVLLAQSEFSAFLKADDNERSELLEKLTDTALYTHLGRRAFEKSKTARETLKQLQDQAGGIAPLSTEQREALDSELHGAMAELKALQLQGRRVEQQQQWHQSAAQLQAQRQQAVEQLDNARQQWAERATPRRQLQQLDLLAAQRHLFEREQQLRQDIAPCADTITEHQGKLDQLQALHGVAAQVQQEVEQALQQALEQQRQAAPDLQRAFAQHSHLAHLEQEVAPLQPTLDALRSENREAAGSRATLQQRQQDSAALLQRIAEDLARSEPLAALAEAWQAYRPRLQQIMLLSNRLRQGEAELPALQQQAAEHQRQVDEQRRMLQQCHDQAGCTAEQLPTQLQTLNQQLHQQRLQMRDIERLEQVWQRREEQHQRLQLIVEQQHALERQRETCTAQGMQLKHERERAEQHLQTLSQLLERQRLARSESVEHLRTQLQEDHPCPVCGSREHPFQQADALLQALDTHDEAEHQRATAAVQQLIERLAERRAELLGVIEQHKALRLQEQALREQDPEQALQQHPLGPALLAQPADARAAWLSQQSASLTAQLDQHEQHQQRLMAVQAQATRLSQSLRLAEQAAQASEQHLQSQQRHLQVDGERLADERQQVTPLLEPATRQALLEDPAGTFMQLDARVGERLQQLSRQHDEQQAFDQRRQVLDEQMRAQQGLEHQLHTLEQRLAVLVADSTETRARLHQLLGDHPDPAQWQQALEHAVQKAREGVEAHQRHRHELQTQQVQAVGELNAARQRLASLEAALADVSHTLAAWRAAHPDILDDELHALLAVQPSAVDRLRHQVQQAEAAMSQAQVLLDEREQRLRDHRQQGEDVEPIEQLQAHWQALQTQLPALEQHCAELRARQADDQRRLDANRELQHNIGLANVEYQRWARLADLIGSAKGDVFRNIAQAYNLDVLVHHANAQLRQLVGRYRLKRGGSMLGLLVCDVEMGDELRSVHSLSGGETFLVSLGLALGLASMASSTLRIESLFIDEGFGSLDPESLQLAMDALDGLQAQGRKVAVISHVQEMHERIPVQIRVRRQGNGLSDIQVTAH